jgi:hypothetical protein
VKAGLLNFNPEFFEQRRDAVGKLGSTTDQKLSVALRLLGQGVGADSVVEVSRMSESLTSICLKGFCAGVVRVFGDTNLRLPSSNDLKLI